MWWDCILLPGELVTRTGDTTDEEKVESKKKGISSEPVPPNPNLEMLVSRKGPVVCMDNWCRHRIKMNLWCCVLSKSYKIDLSWCLFLVESASKLEPCVCLHQLLLAYLSPGPNQRHPVFHVIHCTSVQYPKSCRLHDTCCLATVYLIDIFPPYVHNHCSWSMTGLHCVVFFMYVHIIVVIYLAFFLFTVFPPSLLLLYPWQCHSVLFFCVYQWPYLSLLYE